MQDSVFTKIIKGEIPCYKIYEDAKTFVFLDIEPFTPGHTLVVPKLQIDQFDDLPEEDYQALFATVQKISKHLRATLGNKRNVMQAFGTDVPHAHIHLIPINTSDDYYNPVVSHVADKPYPYQPTKQELAELAAKLRLPDEL